MMSHYGIWSNATQPDSKFIFAYFNFSNFHRNLSTEIEKPNFNRELKLKSIESQSVVRNKDSAVLKNIFLFDENDLVYPPSSFSHSFFSLLILFIGCFF
jgi:hypothetical protein